MSDGVDWRAGGLRRSWGLLLITVLLFGGASAGCSSSEPTQLPPDQRYGHRYDGHRAPDGRLNLELTPPEPDTDYFYYPAIYDSVNVRPAPFTRAQGGEPATSVELLIKGSFPDDCTELHDVEQERAGNIVNVQATMRRAQGAVCHRVRRAYRFYVPIEGTFRPGDYTLKVNRINYTFSLRVPEDG